MNVASLDLCRELYELSGWDDLLSDNKRSTDMPRWGISKVPQYDLGYLLRKLPLRILALRSKYWLSMTPMDRQGTWGASYESDDGGEPLYFEFADNPEDVVAKLAIELFKQGVLTRDGDV